MRMNSLPLVTSLVLYLSAQYCIGQADGMEGDRKDFTLQETIAEKATRTFDGSAILQEEVYEKKGADGSSDVFIPMVTNWKGKEQIIKDDLLLTQEDPSQDYASFQIGRIANFPVTIDIKMRIEFEKTQGWVSLYVSDEGKHIDLQCKPDGLWDKDTLVPFDSSEYHIFRYVIDESTKGRIYLLDKKRKLKGSVGVIWCKYKNTDAPNSVSLRIHNAKVFVKEITIYDALP